MKRILFLFLIMMVVLTTAFSQTDWVEKSYEKLSWKQPSAWQETEESFGPGIAYYQGKIDDGMELKDGVIFVILSDPEFIDNMLDEMQKDENTVIRVSGEDLVNGMKRSFYNGTVDEDGSFSNFAVSHFPNEDREKEFLTIAMIKGPKSRDYKTMVEQVNLTFKSTEEKILITKPEAIVVTKTTLATDKDVYEQNEDIIVTFKNAPGQSSYEWIGLFMVGDSNLDYRTWEYLDGEKNGVVTFIVPDQDGEYFFKLFDPDNLTEELAISNQFTILKEAEPEPEAVYTLKFKQEEKSTYLTEEMIEIIYEIPESITGQYPWIGIVPSNIEHGEESVNDSHDLTYQYLRSKSGTLIFKAPAAEGSYDFRLNDSDSNGTEQAYITFTVVKESAASIVVEKDEYETGSMIKIAFKNAPAETENDWIALYKAESDDTLYIRWLYLQGNKEGTADFQAPEEAGEYQFRMFSNNSYTKVAESGVFKIKEAKPVEMESLFINDYSLSSQLVDKKPVDEKVRFTFDDEKIYMWLQIDKYIDSHEAKWEWIKPDGTVYDIVELTMKPASEYGYLSISKYGMWSWLTISSIDSTLTGIWKVNFYLDGELLITRQFMLQ